MLHKKGGKKHNRKADEDLIASAIPITPQNLSDTFILLESESDSLKKIYKAIHPASVNLRGAYLNIASTNLVQHKIVLTDKSLQIKIYSHGFKVAYEELLVGASFDQVTKGEVFGVANERTFFSDDKKALITTSTTAKKGSGIRTRRLVDGGNLLMVQHEWTRKEKTVTSTRYYQRKTAIKSSLSSGKEMPLPQTDFVILVIGGAGFLGQHLVDHILTKDWDTRIRVFDIQEPVPLDPRVEFVKGNICELNDLLTACKGVHTIFHTASPPEGRPRELYEKVNVQGTNNVIKAAIQSNVKQIVFTSTASVVFDGSNIVNGDETLPYVTKFLDPYIETKIIAEKAILAANSENLKTCAIRPSGIFGPRDAQAWPGIIAAGKAGKSKFQIGSGKNLMDWTYVDNVAHAHCLAAEKLSEVNSKAGGEAFFITNNEPLPFWEMPKFVWKSLGYPLPRIVLPATLLIVIAWILDLIVFILSPIVTIKPTLTYFRTVLATRSRSFSSKKAKEILGYEPIVSLAEGMEKSLEYFRSIENK